MPDVEDHKNERGNPSGEVLCVPPKHDPHEKDLREEKAVHRPSPPAVNLGCQGARTQPPEEKIGDPQNAQDGFEESHFPW